MRPVVNEGLDGNEVARAKVPPLGKEAVYLYCLAEAKEAGSRGRSRSSVIIRLAVGNAVELLQLIVERHDRICGIQIVTRIGTIRDAIGHEAGDISFVGIAL